MRPVTETVAGVYFVQGAFGASVLAVVAAFVATAVFAGTGAALISVAAFGAPCSSGLW